MYSMKMTEIMCLKLPFLSCVGVSGNWIEIAYGTSSGAVRVIVQHPETVGSGPQLFQTFTVHRSPVTKIMLSEKHLVSGNFCWKKCVFLPFVCGVIFHIAQVQLLRFIFLSKVYIIEMIQFPSYVQVILGFCCRSPVRPTGSRSKVDSDKVESKLLYWY